LTIYMTQTRMYGFGLMATLVVLAVLMMARENRISAQQEIVAESNGLRGVELLAAQAENLDRTEARKSAGENMASFDGMLNKFTTSAMPDFTKDLLEQAPKPNEYAIKPDRFGAVPEDKTMRPTVNEDMDDLENDDDILLQMGGAEAEWTPQGQSGLSDAISKHRQEQEASELKSDGLEGTDVLSAIGLTTEQESNEDAELMETEELALFQSPPSHLTKDGKVPASIASKIPVVKSLTSSLSYNDHPDYEKEEDNEVDQDFGGSDILSAAGIGSFKQEPQLEKLGRITKDDLDFDLDLSLE